MRNWQTLNAPTQTIGVLLFDRFSNHCLANAVEPLRAANSFLGRAAYSWEFLTLDGKSVASSSGLPVTPDKALTAECSGEALFVMPSYDYRALATPACTRALRTASRRYHKMVGMDAGSWLLASADLLNGKRATIHWEELESFGESFAEVDARRERLVVDGNRWTCGGAMTAFDLVLRMIGETHGESLRLEVAAFFMHSDPNSGLEPSGVRPRSRIVTAAVAAMRENLEEPLAISLLATQLGCRQKELEILFKAELGAGPRTVYRRFRLMAARRYVQQTGMSVAEIAVRCGYADPSAMTRAFSEEFATTPRQLRALADR